MIQEGQQYNVGEEPNIILNTYTAILVRQNKGIIFFNVVLVSSHTLLL